MKNDPCFSCILPECDDTHAKCAVRRLYRSYNYKLANKRHDDITDAERDAASRIFDSWKLERMAQASEGVRPYRRRGSPWHGDEARGAS